MNKGTRMLLLNGRDKEKERRRRMGVTYEDWTPQDRHMPTTWDQPDMGWYDERIHSGMDAPEGAFYDRRGRRHYDDGRFAPRSEYGGEPESRRRYHRYSDGRFAPRSEYGDMRGPGETYGGYSAAEDRGSTYTPPRMIGFGRDWESDSRRSDATMPQYREMDRMQGRRDQPGGAYSEQLPRFNWQTAQEWTSKMENSDGTRGPHWTMEQTTEAMKKHNLDFDPAEWYAVLNSIYSDYCEALKKNNASTMDTYVALAKAWLEDEDAVKDKAAAYFAYVVKH